MVGALNPFMFIFTCRPGNHPFLKITDEFGGKTEIALQCLSRNSIRELVAEILRIDNPNDCTSLANYISRITNGSEWKPNGPCLQCGLLLVGTTHFNILHCVLSTDPFFIRQQISSLRDEGLLRFGNDGWVWDVNEIEEMHDDVLEDVVIMLLEKMKRLPPLTQQVLKVRAATIINLIVVVVIVHCFSPYMGPHTTDMRIHRV